MIRRLKLNKILIVIVLLIAALITEGIIIKSTTEIEPEKKVLIFNCELKRNTKITEECISEKTFRLLNIPEQAIKDKNQVLNTYTSRDITNGEVILNNSYTDEKIINDYKAKNGHVLFSVKFDSPEKANNFNVNVGEKVKLVYAPNDGLNENLPEEYKKTKKFNVEIIEINDVNLSKENEDEYMAAEAMYITFEGKEQDAIFIINAKQRGRLEIIS
ncbi:hypothetical protein SH1V18_47770 [Vallitalea longa]|uniref:Uncharacterized protein n=1 Tax=Vallitalea longa TaxID=2936439 RepID=A0A9W6DI62_9FIRM|nr:hypothetical protein [Vallitalea longa]GKX32297.1 hypothetical protein SH1V18_47770 [Vallitalea longa]